MCIRDRYMGVIGTFLILKMRRRDEDSVTSIWVERQSSIIGSTAGAGSGEFHHYRRQRRRERARLLQMEKEIKDKEVQDQFEAKKKDINDEFDEVTRKRAEKRKRREENRKKKRLLQQKADEAKKINKFDNDGSFLQRFLETKKKATEQTSWPEQNQSIQESKPPLKEKSPEKKPKLE
eukprot:TRINITY_DN24742_c0_g1_i1.p1 TRINITY_DN24742_c0_g1~~TRINITY_DN24742_c0_g1_i1.p1  ORF type:complete len:178 (+),score=44.53 TRINITY_DN24742_c0_g1_i1:107-640(+)